MRKTNAVDDEINSIAVGHLYLCHCHVCVAFLDGAEVLDAAAADQFVVVSSRLASPRVAVCRCVSALGTVVSWRLRCHRIQLVSSRAQRYNHHRIRFGAATRTATFLCSPAFNSVSSPPQILRAFGSATTAALSCLKNV